VLWGRGRQVATFLNAVQVENSTVEYVVDEDPARNGKFVAGTAQQTVSPAFLKEYRPQTIIAFNSRRRQQIRQQAEALGLTPLIMVA
jgi:prophage tail gpP-like protein